THFKAISQIP
ncbi:hypothetical protein MIMGU_mgv1a0245402mg, partial [Erythranthe guttata]